MCALHAICAVIFAAAFVAAAAGCVIAGLILAFFAVNLVGMYFLLSASLHKFKSRKNPCLKK